jgi:hypothetical protein
MTFYENSGFNIFVERGKLPADVPGVELRLLFAIIKACMGSGCSSGESALLQC